MQWCVQDNFEFEQPRDEFPKAVRNAREVATDSTSAFTFLLRDSPGTVPGTGVSAVFFMFLDNVLEIRIVVLAPAVGDVGCGTHTRTPSPVSSLFQRPRALPQNERLCYACHFHPARYIDC